MFHPFLNARVRLSTVAGLRSKGEGILRALVLASSVDDGTISDGLTALAADRGITLPPELTDTNATGVVGKLGDGTIIQAIKDFLNSPLGQELEKALIAFLIALLTGA